MIPPIQPIGAIPTKLPQKPIPDGFHWWTYTTQDGETGTVEGRTAIQAQDKAKHRLETKYPLRRYDARSITVTRST